MFKAQKVHEHLMNYLKEDCAKEPIIKISPRNLEFPMVTCLKFTQITALGILIILLAFCQISYCDVSANLNELCDKAFNLYVEGNKEEALNEINQAIKMLEYKYGSESPELIRPLTLLTLMYESQQDKQKTADLERLLYLQESFLGSDHKDVGKTMSRLIALYERSGQKEKAEQLNRKAFSMWGDPKVVQKERDMAKWKLVSKSSNYDKIKTVLKDYHNTHTYSKSDQFWCTDMAMDVWNMLKTVGVRGRIAVGNVENDIGNGNSILDYIAHMNHAWVMAEVSTAEWIPLETTGGRIVDPTMSNYTLYNKGTYFDTPAEFKDFNETRNQLMQTCQDAIKMVKMHDLIYAGRRTSASGLEYRGKATQKVEDCERLIKKLAYYVNSRN